MGTSYHVHHISVHHIDACAVSTGWGMGIFMVSSVGCGFANSFWTLLACRIVMGAGEASIINLTGELHCAALTAPSVLYAALPLAPSPLSPLNPSPSPLPSPRPPSLNPLLFFHPLSP